MNLEILRRSNVITDTKNEIGGLMLVWHCDICEKKTENESKRCDCCIERFIRMDKEIKRRINLKREITA